MGDEKHQDLEHQLNAERERVRQLELERTKQSEQIALLQNQLANYQPMAQAWLREHMPTKEECERILTEMLAHPESLLDFKDVVRELEEEFGKPDSGENAA